MKHPYLNIRAASLIFLGLNLFNLISVIFCFTTFAIFQGLFDDLLGSKFFKDILGTMAEFVLLPISLIVIKSGFAIWLSKKSLKGIRWSQTFILILSGISCILLIILIGNDISRLESLEEGSYTIVSALIPLVLNAYICITMYYLREKTT